jgi:cytidylate kinase
MKKIVIAIDGPSASGKGTIAKKLAQHFDLSYLNTGAIYRLIALRIINNKIDPNNFEQELVNLTKNISEQDLENEELFSETVGGVASIIAKNKNLRESIFQFQRNFVNEGLINKQGCVLDGRDTTTVICPDADFKFFITADVEIRAQRRYKQFPNQDYSQILAQLKKQ